MWRKFYWGVSEEIYNDNRGLTPFGIQCMVGVERFELPTSCSQSRRATGLRYTPNRRLRSYFSQTFRNLYIFYKCFSAVRSTFENPWCREGDSNPHNLTVVRFWVWCVYQFHPLGITDIIDEIPILVKTQTIEILPESSSKFLKISSQNPTIVRFW